MLVRVLQNTTLILVLSSFLLPSVSFGQDLLPAAKKPAITFDAEKLAHTSKSLSSFCALDFESAELADILVDFKGHFKLKFDTKHAPAEITKKAVSVKVQCKLGEALLTLLREVDCTFTITPDGSIRILKLPTKPASMKVPPTKPEPGTPAPMKAAPTKS